MDRGGGQGEEKHLIFIDTLLSSYIEDDQADLAVRGFACTYGLVCSTHHTTGLQGAPVRLTDI